MPEHAFRRLLGWSRTVRARSALVSVAIVGAAFSLFGLGVTSLLQASLYQSAANTARAEAMAISSVISNQGLPLGSRRPQRFLPISEGDMAAQVVGPGGTVLRSSRDVGRRRSGFASNQGLVSPLPHGRGPPFSAAFPGRR